MSFFKRRSKKKEKSTDDLTPSKSNMSSTSSSVSITPVHSNTISPQISRPQSVGPRSIPPDEKILNILPSYHMYKSTVSRALTPSQENFKVDPPTYEVTPTTSPFDLSPMRSPLDTPLASGASTPGYFGEFSPPTASAPPSSSSVPSRPDTPLQADDQFNEDSANIWENTVLANAHRLKNLTHTDNKLSNDLDIQIHVTERVCEKGVEPIPMNPQDKEFCQGDYIHGYVTIQNMSTQPINFEMVYVVFEGQLVTLDNNQGIIDTKKPCTVYKFLNMIDLFASWSYANIDRLVTDNGDPHDWCDGETDPWDNTVLSIGVKRLFQPGVKYKRFFTFRVPEKLLDDACEIHDLGRHQEVPPSLGHRRDMGVTNNSTSLAHNDIKDFSFVDASIFYSVDARVIGKASEYHFQSTSRTGDEYVIAKEVSVPIRVLPLSNPELDSYANSEECNLFYKAFVDSVLAKIQLGRELLNLPPEEGEAARAGGGIASPLDLTPMNSMESSVVKVRQLYATHSGGDGHGLTPISSANLKVPHKSINEESYQSFLAYRKKTLTGYGKSTGILTLTTPKVPYRVSYVVPERYRKEGVPIAGNTIITIPLEVQFLHENESQEVHLTLPDIKDVVIDVVVFTAKAKKHQIPVEFTHEHLFREQEVEGSKRHGGDNFDTIVVKRFQNYIQELTDLIRRVGADILLVETQLFKDLKSMAFLNAKYINLAVAGAVITSASDNSSGVHKNLSSVPWERQNSETVSSSHTVYSKKFEVTLDISKAHLRSTSGGHRSGEFCLVPDFQSCHMARMYYLKICVKLSNNQVMTVNAPLIVEKY
ncbi:hypothetical protein CAAN3_10S03312 [[Candida] anglica]